MYRKSHSSSGKWLRVTWDPWGKLCRCFPWDQQCDWGRAHHSWRKICGSGSLLGWRSLCFPSFFYLSWDLVLRTPHMHACGARCTRRIGKLCTKVVFRCTCSTKITLQYKNHTTFFFLPRGDMSKPDGYYDLPPIRRTTEELKELACKKSGENYCCCHEPLLNIPLDHIILDELHLMLRMTDILLGPVPEKRNKLYQV